MKKAAKIPLYCVYVNDLLPERNLLEQIVRKVNRQSAKTKGTCYEVINKPLTQQISKGSEKVGIAIFLVGNKWLTRNGTALDKEYDRVVNSNLEPLFYLRCIPEEMMADPGEQLTRVIEFRNRLESEKQWYCRNYEQLSMLGGYLERDLHRWISGTLSLKQAENVPDRIIESLLINDGIADFGPVQHLPEFTYSSEIVDDAMRVAVVAQKEVQAGHFTKADEHCSRAVSIYPDPEILKFHGNLLERMGFRDRAKRKYEQLLEAGRQTGDVITQADAYYHLGLLDYLNDMINSAEDMFCKALNIFEQFKSRAGEADVKVCLGLIYQRKDLDLALEMYKAARKIYSELGRPALSADLQELTGDIYSGQGRYNLAVKAYREALVLNSNLKRLLQTAGIYLKLGTIYSNAGNLQFSEKICKEALAVYEKHKFEQGIFSASVALGEVWLKMGKPEAAEEILKRTEEKCDVTRGSDNIIKLYTQLGIVHFKSGIFEKAEESYLDAFNLCDEETRKDLQAEIYDNLSLIHFEKKKFGAARKVLGMSAEIWTGLNRKDKLTVTYSHLGLLYQEMNQWIAAEEMYKKSIAAAREIGLHEQISKSLCKLGKLYKSVGSMSEAEKVLLEAAAVIRKFNLAEAAAEVYFELGEIYFCLDQCSRAKLMYSKVINNIQASACDDLLQKVCVSLGHLYYREGNSEKAKHFYNKAIAKAGHDVTVFTRLGLIYLKSGQLEKAEEMKKKAYKLILKKTDEMTGNLRTFSKVSRISKC